MRSKVRILTEAFRALSKTEKGNLLWHLQQGTPILCGVPDAIYFFVIAGKP